MLLRSFPELLRLPLLPDSSASLSLCLSMSTSHVGNARVYCNDWFIFPQAWLPGQLQNGGCSVHNEEVGKKGRRKLLFRYHTEIISCLPRSSSAHVHVPVFHRTSITKIHNFKAVTAEHYSRHGVLLSSRDLRACTACTCKKPAQTPQGLSPHHLFLFSVISTEPITL